MIYNFNEAEKKEMAVTAIKRMFNKSNDSFFFISRIA